MLELEHNLSPNSLPDMPEQNVLKQELPGKDELLILEENPFHIELAAAE